MHTLKLGVKPNTTFELNPVIEEDFSADGEIGVLNAQRQTS